MSHRSAAATALLLASSLPYGLALPQPVPNPQVIPFLSELDFGPGPTPLVLPPLEEVEATSMADAPSIADATSVVGATSVADPALVSDPPTVTVVGTIVQAAVESAIESLTEALQDAVESVTTAEWIKDPFPTGGLESDADILPLTLPGVLPVETDLPPVDVGDDMDPIEIPSLGEELPLDLSILLPDEALDILPFDGDDLFELEVIELPLPDVTLSEDDFPDIELDVDELPTPNVTLPIDEDDLPETNELEVIDLPPPNTTVPDVELPTVSEVPYGDDMLIAPPVPTGNEVPYGDDMLIAEPIPIVPIFPGEATVPISTFNAVVQPLLSVIQALLNSLPGNVAPPFPDIFVNPLRPTSTPDIFIDPLIGPLVDPIPAPLPELVDPIPSPLPEVVDTSDVPLQKRQAPVPVPLTTQGIFDLVASILQSINALVQAIPVVGPVVADVVDDVAGAVLTPSVEVPPVPLPSPIDVVFPDVLDNGPAVPLPLPLDVEFPDAPIEGPNVLNNGPAVPLPFPLDVEFPDAPVGDPNVLNNGPAVPLPLPLDVEFPDVPVEEPALPIAPPALPVSNVTVPSLEPPSPPLSEALPTDVAIPEPEVPSILPAPVGPLSEIPSEVLDIPFPDDIEGIDWAAFESPPFSDLPETPTVAEELPIPDDVLNIPVPDFDEDGNVIDVPVVDAPAVADVPAEVIPGTTAVAAAAAVASVVAAGPAPLPTSLDAFGDFDFGDDVLPDWPFTEIPDVVTPDANGELPGLDDITEPAGLLLPVEAPTLALPTDIILPAAPTSLFDIPVPEGFEDLDFPEPDTVVSILPAPPVVNEFDIPADVLNIPWPDFDEDGFPLDIPTAPNAPAAPPVALPTDINWADFPVPDDWVDFDELPAVEAPAVALPEAPAALPTDLDFFDIPVPDDFAELVDPLPVAVLPPAVEEPAIPEDVLNIPVPELGEDGLPIEDIAPPLSEESFGAGFPIQALPDIPLVLPAADDLLPVEGAAALTEAISAVPTDALSGLPTGVLAAAFNTAPTSLVPRLPFQVPGGARPVEKRQLQLSNFLQPRPAVTQPPSVNIPGVQIVKPVFDLISSLLSKLGIDAAQVPNLAAALSLAPALPPVLPIPGVPTVSEIAEIVENVAAVVDSVTSALPLPTLPSILPVPLVLPPPKALEDVLAVVTAQPALQPTRAVAAVLPVVATPATAVGGSRRARRAIQEMQQGPASDWESFLGELDESYQSELAGLIHDSAQAVNEDALDDFTETLKADIEDLSDSTKAQIVEGFATTFGKRDMRHGKRQSPPGALSIGPNLDDADKADFSSVLGRTGSLDPFGQTAPARFFPGSPVDSARPEGIRPPVGAFNSVGSTRDPELAAILAAGGLDPNGMLSQFPDGDIASNQPLQDPYADIRGPWDTALDTDQPLQGLEGLRETLQASKENHIGSRVPLRSSGGEASARNVVSQSSSMLAASQDAEQRNVLLWFHRYVKPSWNKQVDAEIEVM